MPAHPQLARDDRLRRMAMQPVKVAETRTGWVAFGPGVFLTLPARAALDRLVELHKRAVGERSSSVHIRKLPDWSARILHRRETVSALATVTVVNPKFRRTLVDAIFAFVGERRSIEGIESLMFSAIIGAEREHPELAKEGRRLLTACGSPRVLGGGYGQTPVVDPVARQMTFLDPLSVAGFVNGGPGGTVPGVGNPVPGGFGDVEDNTPEQNSCIKVWTVVGTIVGAVGGAALGAVAGNSTNDSKGLWIGIGIGGGLLAGSLGGAQGGQSLGQGAFCSNTTSGTAAPSSSPAPTGDTGQSQWEQNLTALGSSSDNTPSPQDQGDYSDGFSAGWAAAQSGGGSTPSSGSDSFGAGYADGYGASSAMQTLPQPGGTGDTPEGGTSGAPEGGSSGGDGGGGTPEGGGSGAGGSMANPEGGGNEGPTNPGVSAVFHHVNPGGPGVTGLSTDDGDGGGQDEGGGGQLASLGKRVVSLPPDLPDPENNPHARTALRQATLAQAALLSEVVAANLSQSLLG